MTRLIRGNAHLSKRAARILAVPLLVGWVLACGEEPGSGTGPVPTETVHQAIEDRGVGLIYVPA